MILFDKHSFKHTRDKLDAAKDDYLIKFLVLTWKVVRTAQSSLKQTHKILFIFSCIIAAANMGS